MSRRIDIPIGSKFGRWTVVGPADPLKRICKNLCWPCRCECGREELVNGSLLRNGRSEKCNYCAYGREGRITVGTRFGRYTAIRFLQRAERVHPRNIWLLRCDCGTERSMSTNQALKSTGCTHCADHRRMKCFKRPYEAAFNVLQHNARNRGIAFSLTYDDFIKLVSTGMCHYCWMALEWVKHGKHCRYQLDRKDNDLGYTSENVVPCCKRCNYSKSNQFTYEEWFAMTECLRAKHLINKSVTYGK